MEEEKKQIKEHKNELKRVISKFEQKVSITNVRRNGQEIASTNKIKQLRISNDHNPYLVYASGEHSN